VVATREHSEPTLLPTEVVEPVDSTGAGDAFCGAFAAEHLRSHDPYLAARAGAEAARIAVSAPGIGGLLAALTPEAAR
jgi:ribokinase